jgi:hypothetical protein
MKKLWIICWFVFLPVAMQAQVVRAKSSNSQTNTPSLQWEIPGNQDTILDFKIYRSPHNQDAFEQIKTSQFFNHLGDTLTLGVIDTTLTTKGIWQYYIQIQTPEGTSRNSEILFAHNFGHLAPPEVFNLRTKPVRGEKAIELTWELRNPVTVVTQAIFRSRNFDEGFELVTRLPAEARSYVDQVSRANEPWFYFILIHDFFGYQPPSVRVHGFSTHAETPLRPLEFSALRQGQHVNLNWRKMGDNIFGYQLYRRENNTGDFSPLGAPFYLPGELISATDSLPVSDSVISLEYYCVSISDGYLESVPSDTTLVFFPENILASPPAEVDFSFENEGQIRLFWTTDDPIQGASGYNVYRKVNGNPPVKINTEPIWENTFLDTKIKEQGEITYQVEALNLAGKPSARRTEVSLENQLRQTRLVLSCSQAGNNILLQWVPLSLEGVKNLRIMRQTNDDEPALLTTVANESGTYTDNRTTPETAYVYYVIAEMTDGRLIMVNNGVSVSRY